MKWLACIFLFFQFHTLAQKDSSFYLNQGIRFNRNDFFVQNGIQKQNGRFQEEFGFAFGINKTIFQQRFYPELNVRLNYDLLQKQRVHLQPTASIHSSLININRQQTDVHFFQEFLLGFQFGFGNRFRTFFCFESGLQNQRFKSALTGRYEGFNTLAYSFQISVRYAL